jgi:hypothetical protein
VGRRTAIFPRVVKHAQSEWCHKKAKEMSKARTDCVVPQEDRRITGKAMSAPRSAWYRNKVEVEGQRGVHRLRGTAERRRKARTECVLPPEGDCSGQQNKQIQRI